MVGCDYHSVHGLGPTKAIDILRGMRETIAATTDYKAMLFWDTLAHRIRTTGKGYAADPAKLQLAFLAYHNPVVFRPSTSTFVHANSAPGSTFPSSVGTLPADPENELRYTLVRDRPDSKGGERRTVYQVLRPGEALPTALQCWMIPGSRPALLPARCTSDQLVSELKANGLDYTGDIQELRARASRHGLTIRKPATDLSAEECKGVLVSREWRLPKTLNAKREQVQSLYALEDTPEHGPPRLKDPSGIALLRHLALAQRAVLTPQQGTLRIPSDGWVSASEGLPLSMDVVRAWFREYGEPESGDFKCRQIKEGYARIKNRTSLLNFGYHGPPALPPDPKVADDSDVKASSRPPPPRSVSSSPSVPSSGASSSSSAPPRSA